MKQRIFQILKWSGIGFIFFFLILLIVAQVYEDRIGELVVKELNKSLKAPITVEHVDLTLVRTFPDASVVLSQVSMPDTKKGILLNAKTLSLNFGFLSLFQDVIDIESVVVADGSLNILKDINGNSNYDVFLTSTETSDKETDVKIDLQNATLRNMYAIYEDKQFQQSGILRIESLKLSGAFSTQQFELESTAEIEIEFLNTKDGEILSGRHIAYETVAKVDLEKGEYNLKNTNLYVESNKFTVNGKVITKENYTDFDVSLKGIDCNLYSVISLLPKKQITALEDFSSRGNFHIESTLQGRLSKTSMPEFDLTFGLKDGYVNSKRLQNELKNVSFEVQIENDEKSATGKAFVEMTQFVGELLGEKLEAMLFVEDIENPLIDFRFQGKIPMEAVFGFFGDEKFVQSGSGAMEFKGIIVEGYYKDMLSLSGIRNIVANGLIAFEDMSLKIKDEKVSLSQGEIFINNNNLQINNLDVKVAQNDLQLKGSFQNLLPVLLKDSTTSDAIKLIFNTEVKSEKIDLDELLAFVEKVQEEPEKLETTREETLTEKGSVTASPYYEFLKLFNGDFSVEVGSFKYDNIKAEGSSGNLTVDNGRVLLQNINIADFEIDKIVAKDFTGNLAFQGKMMIAKDVSVNTMGGNIKMTSNIYLDEETFLDGFIECTKLDGYTLFSQLDNFGQDVLTDKNIRGEFDAKIRLKNYWDKAGNVLYDKLYALADITISNGEIVDFDLFTDFSKFVKVEDLKNVKFTEMRNQLEFKNERLTIPAMFIQNNAVNMTIAGWQDYDLDFDYKIKINAGQTIANKFKRFNPRKKAIKAKRDGWFNIYVHVFGNVDKYDFAYSKKTVEAALEADLNQKFKQIQNDILTEFQKNALEEPEDWENNEVEEK
ncbi:MAG: AsmA-like C-terminal region-containing protein [Saprospiraceae bacterium]